MDNRPIGIFDSGLGGLTVLEALLKELPNEDYIYVGDTAHLPYGSKTPETIITYARQIVKFLIRKNVKLIIIACGTASAIAFETLQKEFSIPIQTIIEPTAKLPLPNKVGVIATKATIQSQAWEKAIHIYHPNCKVYSKACPLFVPLVEENLTTSEIAKLTISMYLSDFIDWKVDCLILGCTHYPLLLPSMQEFLPSSMQLMNVNQTTAIKVKEFLIKKQALRLSRKLPERFAYTTDTPDNFQENAKSFCQISFHQVEKINLEIF